MTDETKTQVAVLKREMQMIAEQNSKDHADIKTDVCSVKTDIKDLKEYIIEAMNKKADKEDVDHLDNRFAKLDDRFWAIVVTLLFMTLGIIFALFK